MEFTREICLTWIASAGLNPEIISRLLRSGISPESLYAGFWKNGCFPLEDVKLQKNMTAVLKKTGLWKPCKSGRKSYPGIGSG